MEAVISPWHKSRCHDGSSNLRARSLRRQVGREGEMRQLRPVALTAFMMMLFPEFEKSFFSLVKPPTPERPFKACRVPSLYQRTP